MDPEEFRKHGHSVVDWIADYMETIADRPVVGNVSPGDVRNSLPSSPPEQGEPFEEILADVDKLIMPGMTHWGHPGWFAYFPSNSSPPSVLGEMMAAGLGAQCMSWITSPAATELEQVVMEWLRQLLAVPDGFTGSIQDTASTASLLAFLTARDKLGQNRDTMAAYWSREAHSGIPKAARLAGIPPERQRIIPVDGTFAMDVDALAEAIALDLENGLTPGIVVATMGTTSSTACDPLRGIGTVAVGAGAWFHVDAAYGGTAAILPEIRPLLDGLELADSYVTNPHKWLMTSFDCSAYFVKDVEALLRTCSTNPEYLKTVHDPEVVNYRDWGVALGRRFRALKLWFVLRSYGAVALRSMIKSHLEMAKHFAGLVDDATGWERLAPVPLGLVCCRHVPPELVGDEPAIADHNQMLLDRVNASGEVFLTHTMLGGKYAIRVAIGSFRTRTADVDRVWELLTAG